ncbi:hypothetical protein [Variovorax sp. HW608]|uniref:hypothetical protein n=1 Tax=Variovorax sp. HW608 TaxID=1034889 RepID=UPI0012FE2F9F|nr:hypothetical protein [Variovorax sp. HW608]
MAQKLHEASLEMLWRKRAHRALTEQESGAEQGVDQDGLHDPVVAFLHGVAVDRHAARTRDARLYEAKAAARTELKAQVLQACAAPGAAVAAIAREFGLNDLSLLGFGWQEHRSD